MMNQKINIILCIICFIICQLNALFYKYIPIPEVRIFLYSYFKDIVGASAFIGCCNIILYNFKMGFYKILYIEIFLFFCGLFWEYVTPLYRQTTSDVNDIFAYMLGGFIYWVIMKIIIKLNRKEFK